MIILLEQDPVIIHFLIQFLGTSLDQLFKHIDSLMNQAGGGAKNNYNHAPLMSPKTRISPHTCSLLASTSWVSSAVSSGSMIY